MFNSEIELYIESTRSGIEVSGTIDNEYVELRYNHFLKSQSSRSFVDGILNNPECSPVMRTYGEICGMDIQTDEFGYWKPNSRRKVNEEMNVYVDIVENFLEQNNYMVLN